MGLTKKQTIAVLLVVVLALASIIGSGFAKKTDVIVYEYTVAEDGTSVNLVAAPTSAFGRARGFQEEVTDGNHYLTFYRTFGFFGFHASEINHVVEVAEEDSGIYFNRPDGEFELVLEKDPATGEWVQP
ncbi:MAG: hypothetical protein IKY34_04230 [Ruminiclostridium sp.]|nr:hypothetical protein [Ruminiclostridium sp.]